MVTKEISTNFEGKGIEGHKSVTAKKYSQLKHKHIKEYVLDQAIHILQKQSANFTDSIKQGYHDPNELRRQQNRCGDAIRCLQTFKEEGFSSEQLEAVRNAAKRPDNESDTKVNRYIADALFKAKEQDLLDWKKNFDDYSKNKLEWLCKANKLLQGQENISEFPDEYKIRVKKYNRVRKEGVALNARVSEFNDFFPKETPVEELKLPEKLKHLDTEEANKSWFSSMTKSDLMKVALGVLALAASVVNPVSARPIDNAPKGFQFQLDPPPGNRHVFPRNLMGNPLVTLSQDASTDAFPSMSHTHTHTQPTLPTEPTTRSIEQPTLPTERTTQPTEQPTPTEKPENEERQKLELGLGIGIPVGGLLTAGLGLAICYRMQRRADVADLLPDAPTRQADVAAQARDDEGATKNDAGATKNDAGATKNDAARDSEYMNNQMELEKTVKDAKNCVEEAQKIAEVSQSLPNKSLATKIQQQIKQQIEQVEKSIQEAKTCLDKVGKTSDVLSQRSQNLKDLMNPLKEEMGRNDNMLDKMALGLIDEFKSIHKELVHEYWIISEDDLKELFQKEKFDEFNRDIKHISDNILSIDTRNTLAKEYGNIVNGKKKLLSMLDEINKCFKENSEYFVNKRKEQIENLLKQLPTLRPTLDKLPEKLWWLLFIDAPLHPKAEVLSNPGELFDLERSPGYLPSMIKLFKEVLATANRSEELFEITHATEQTSGESRKDYYDWYTEVLHERATEYLPPESREKYRRSNGSVPLFRYVLPKMSRNELEQHERQAALEELYEEHVNNLPLLQKRPSNLAKYDLDDSRQHPEIARHLPQGIAMAMKNTKQSTMWIITLYRRTEIRAHANAILESYCESRKVPDRDEYQKLREIAKTVRAMHVLHPKSDGNGRTNIYGLMNYLLIKEGFCPTILPNGPDGFGGTKTVDALVKDMLIGMLEFDRRVKEYQDISSSGMGKQHS